MKNWKRSGIPPSLAVLQSQQERSGVQAMVVFAPVKPQTAPQTLDINVQGMLGMATRPSLSQLWLFTKTGWKYV